MDALIIDSPLAERLRALAEQENRSVEEVIATMLDQYHTDPTLDEIYARIRHLGDTGITLPPGGDVAEMLTEEQEKALIQRAGAGEVSGAAMITEERQQGW